MAKTTLSRTIFIGLGGTGAEAIVRTKSLMLESFDEIPPLVKFLAIDTDSRDKISYKNKSGKTITLDENEFEKFEVKKTADYVYNNTKICSFFPKDMLKRKTSITKGAGQFRACGRLAYIANYNANLKNKLNNIINSVKEWRTTRDEKYDVSDAQTRVFVVFSIAGGTGAGMFVDFPLLLKSINSDISVVAVALLPDVYSSLGEKAANCKPNAISGITEYEMIADGKLDDFNILHNHPARKVETHGGSYTVTHDNVYDSFFLVNNESSNNIRYESSKEMADVISRSLYLAAGAVGGSGDSALDNMDAIKAAQESRGRMLRYLGLGSAEMVFSSETVAAYYTLLQAHSLCDKLISSTNFNNNLNEEVQLLIDEWRIQEDNDKDDVINFFSDAKSKMTFPGISDYDETAATKIESKKNSWLVQEKKTLEKITEEGGLLDTLTGNKLSVLQDFVDEKLNSEGGLQYIRRIFPALKGRFESMKDEMNTEKKELNSKLEKTVKVYASKISDINDACRIPIYNIFKNRTRAIEDACEEFKENVDSEYNSHYEIERRTAAIKFYNKIIDRCENIINKTSAFEKNVFACIERASRRIQEIRSQNLEAPFTIDITPKYISTMKVGGEDSNMSRFLKEINASAIILQENLEIDELFSKITNYSKNLEKTKTYKDTDLLDVLSKMPNNDVETELSKLKKSIGIMRKVDPVYENDIVNAVNYVIGVYDANHPAIINKKLNVEKKKDKDEKKVDEIIAGSKNKNVGAVDTGENSGDIMRRIFSIDGRFPELSNTKDPNKIIISVYESAVPAFMVLNFKEYTADMEAKKGNVHELLRYSNEHWGKIIMEKKYSIFPKDEDEALKTWTLAFFVTQVEKEKNSGSMDFIQKQKNGKYSVFTTSGYMGMKELDAKRSAAFQIFQEQQLGKELLPLLQQKINGDLTTYSNKLKELKNDHSAQLYIDDYALHNLAKRTYKSDAHKCTRELIMSEFRYLYKATDITELTS